jgi:ribosome-binding protein aMBF1 (putative translation factor)
MGTVRVKVDPSNPDSWPAGQVDWARVDAITEEDIARQQAEDDAEAMQEVYGVKDIFGEITPAQVLRGLRSREGLKQKDLAATLGISPAHLSAMEHGRRPIGKEMAKRLAKVLGTSYRVFQLY